MSEEVMKEMDYCYDCRFLGTVYYISRAGATEPLEICSKGVFTLISSLRISPKIVDGKPVMKECDFCETK